MTRFLVVPVIIASAVGGSAAEASDLLRLSMVAGGILAVSLTQLSVGLLGGMAQTASSSSPSLLKIKRMMAHAWPRPKRHRDKR